MRLTELEPTFVRRIVTPNVPTQIADADYAITGKSHTENRDQVTHQRDVSFAEAHGIQFLCPKCFKENGGPKGTHTVLCWFKGKVPDDALPGPGRWSPVGTTFEDLSLVAKSSSILLTSGCKWHGFVVKGDVTMV